MNDGVTAVILNWKRPKNVVRILSALRQTELVREAIVWNNNPDRSFHDEWATVLNVSQDVGLYARFAAASLAQHDAVLIQDDDLEVPADSIRSLYRAWLDQPDILHGVFGRRPKPDGSYATNVSGNADAPVVLTRVLIGHRRYAAEFFRVAHEFDEVQRGGRPAGNGEDIIFSYVAMRSSGRLNRIHNVPVSELPAPHSIHGKNWKAHVQHRTRLLRVCTAWLQEKQHETGRDLLHL